MARKNPSILAGAALALAGALGVSGCSPQLDEPADARIGDSYASGVTDDSQRYFSQSLVINQGSVSVIDVSWEGESEDGNPDPQIHLDQRETEPLRSTNAYSLEDNTADRLPLNLKASGNQPSGVQITTVFDPSTNPPEGRVLITYQTTEGTNTAEIVPTWDE